MRKYLLILLLILCVAFSGCAQFKAYAGIGANFGFSTWNTPIPTLCIGADIFDWCSFDLQLGTVVFGNQLKVNQKFRLFNLILASNEFSCFFYGSRPFLTYAVNLGLDIPVFNRASLSIGASYVIWDQLIIGTSDSMADFMLDQYPVFRFNLSIFYTAVIYPGGKDAD